MLLLSGPPSELNDVDFDATAKRRAYPRQRHSMSEDRMDGEEDFDSDEEEEEEEEGRGPPQEEPDHGANLMEEEERAEGVVKLAVYSAYWKAVGACLSPMVLLALFLMQGTLDFHGWSSADASYLVLLLQFHVICRTGGCHFGSHILKARTFIMAQLPSPIHILFIALP